MKAFYIYRLRLSFGTNTVVVKRTAPFLLLLTGLSVLSGYLLSKASLVGKTGIHFFYKEYKFLNHWYKGAAVVLTVWLLLFLLHRWLKQRLPAVKSKLVFFASMAVALIGLYLTYSDFRNDLSHQLLGERFHLGAYLFWIGWILIALFHLWPKKEVIASTTPVPLE